MKANRKTMLIAALAVAVIALAGIGYAAYTGTATNTGNKITTKFVNIDLSKTEGQGIIAPEETIWDGQTLAVEFDSQNNDGTIKYKLNSESASKTMVITVAVDGNDSVQTYKLEISVPDVTGSGFDGTWTYVSGGNNYSVSEGKITVNSGTISTLDGKLVLSLAASENWEEGPIENQINIDPITFTVTSL